MMAPLDLPPRWRLDGDAVVRDGRRPLRISIVTFGLVEAIEIAHHPHPERVVAIIEELRAQRTGATTRRT